MENPVWDSRAPIVADDQPDSSSSSSTQPAEQQQLQQHWPIFNGMWNKGQNRLCSTRNPESSRVCSTKHVKVWNKHLNYWNKVPLVV